MRTVRPVTKYISVLARNFKRCFKFCVVLGWWDGPTGLLRIAVARQLGKTYVHLRDPASRRRVRLRAKSSDVACFEQIFINREYDEVDFVHAKDLALREAADNSRLTIIDCGANIGCSVLWFSNQFPGAHIIAIEPEKENFQLLSHNIRDIPNVRALQAAVWSKKTDVILSNPQPSEWAHQWAFQTVDGERFHLLEDFGRQKASTVTLNDLLPSKVDGRCIVKIDIEGAESTLFAENYEWLNLADIVIIELHDRMFPWKGTSRSFFSAISSQPVDYLRRGENLFCFRDPTFIKGKAEEY